MARSHPRRRRPQLTYLPGFLWFPAVELYGVQRMEYLDDVLVLSGAGVGGGSHVYANTPCVPPRKFFDAPEWAGITDWADELAPYIDQATRMLGVVRATRTCHGSEFDITTGAVVSGPACRPLHVYEAQEVDNSLHIRVD